MKLQKLNLQFMGWRGTNLEQEDGKRDNITNRLLTTINSLLQICIAPHATKDPGKMIQKKRIHPALGND